ncbi:hypothetical protein [Pontibacter virosus]|uniref:Uncharacterized protein n=1 Tax=Pontibacter virosus TaxID=1765052 RepID=A0A2U1AS05_9BACT|nr:hypothetical protein [Pontibacter virosus]PVY39067.1 hypothetical protein C8E01_11354 [Pontibacter virosus]
MKKLYKSCLILACLSFSLYSCDTNKEKDEVLPTQEEIDYIVINANTTDLPVKPGTIAEIDGAFAYRENHYITSVPHRFTIDKKYFWAHYSGQDKKMPDLPLHGSKINGEAMCMNGLTGCDDVRPSTLWNFYGPQAQDRKLKWEYLNRDKSKGYRVEMTNIPTPATVTELPDRILWEENIDFQFERNSAADSIIIALLFVPKDKIDNILPFPVIGGTRSWIFPAKSNESSLTMKKEALQSMGQQSGFPTENDSVFVNVMTSRHVIKNIDNKKMLISYTINDIRPVVLERKID